MRPSGNLELEAGEGSGSDYSQVDFEDVGYVRKWLLENAPPKPRDRFDDWNGIVRASLFDVKK